MKYSIQVMAFSVVFSLSNVVAADKNPGFTSEQVVSVTSRAEQGDAGAQLDLGSLYYRGQGG